ncbi:unnamed protein product [Strongylus vulgaris]|uniref:Receptor ligand binding region domain-containing protein n=1 Tax=Strongylus vulgaris TaxID=40348 RepID=A0A3P7J154_STRVU|nr:unnamed protein product [Strongylus vulgaris]
MWTLLLVSLTTLAPITSTLSCKPRRGGTPVPLGVFLNSAPTKSLDKKLFDAKPAIKLALNYIQNHSCILDGFKLELIYKDTKSLSDYESPVFTLFTVPISASEAKVSFFLLHFDSSCMRTSLND